MRNDGAVVMLRRPEGRSAAAGPARHRLVFAADAVAVRGALQELRRHWEADGLSAEIEMIAEQVLAEVLNNVVEHAHRGRSGGRIEVTVSRCPEGLACAVWDNGAPMPGGAVPDGRLPDTQVAPCDLPEGGFGWAMIRALTQDLRYARCGRWNCLCFRIPPASDPN